MTKLRCSRALWGRGAHREGGTSASTNVEKTYESHSGIGAPSGTPHRAPRPPPPPFTTRKNKKEGTVQHTSRESNPEPSPPKLLETLVQNKNAPHHYSQNKTCYRGKSPTSWVTILFSTCTPCGGTIPRPAPTPCGGKKANPNPRYPPPSDATQPAPEPHPPPHHRDAHPDPHPKQESKPQTSPPKSA